ncbi:MAG: Mur ligase domain-containing protein [Candidatus Sulfotelmatobacter sp.]
MKLALARIAEFVSAVGGFDPEHLAQGYSIDSRTVGPGQLFFAVKGDRLDRHDFVESALEKAQLRRL